MPTIPMPQSRVDPAALPGVRVSTNAPEGAFGVGSALDLSGPTRVAGDIVQEERQKANQLAVLDSDNQLSEFAIQQRGAALARNGKDAMGATADAAAAWQKRTGEIESTLTNDAQKLAFRARAQRHWADLHETIERHAAGEMEKYDQQQTTGALANRLNEAIASIGDPGKVARAIAEQKALVQDWGARNGVAPEMLKERLAAVASKTHLSVLEEMAAGKQDLAAKSYFEAHRDELTGADLIHATGTVKESSVRGESQRQSDAIMAGRAVDHAAPGLLTAGNIDVTRRPQVKNADGSISTVRSMSFEQDGKEILIPTVSPDGKMLTNDQAIARYEKTGEHLGIFTDAASATAYAKQLHDAQAGAIAGQGDGTVPPQATTGRPPTLTEAVARARQIQDPEVRDATEQRIRQSFAELKNAERERTQTNMIAAGNLIDKSGLSAIPPAMWTTFSPAEKASLKSYADQRASGGTISTNWSRWTELVQDASLNPDKFLKANPMRDWRPYLDDGKYAQMVDLQSKIRAGDQKAEDKLHGIYTKAQAVTATLHAAGLGDGGSRAQTAKDKEAISQLRLDIDAVVRDEEESTGKPVSVDRVKAIASDLATQHIVSTPGMLFGNLWPNESKKRLDQLGANDSLVLSIADVPAAMRTTLRQALVQSGRAASNDNVIAAYKQHLLTLRVARGSQ